MTGGQLLAAGAVFVVVFIGLGVVLAVLLLSIRTDATASDLVVDVVT